MSSRRTYIYVYIYVQIYIYIYIYIYIHAYIYKYILASSHTWSRSTVITSNIGVIQVELESLVSVVEKWPLFSMNGIVVSLNTDVWQCTELSCEYIVYVSMYMYICIQMYVDMYAYIYIYIYVYIIHTYVYMYTYIYIHICTNISCSVVKYRCLTMSLS